MEKNFNKKLMLELLYEDVVPNYVLVEDTIVDHTRWSVEHVMVFLDKESNKYYRVRYSNGATEAQMESPFDFADDEVLCQEVKPVQKMMTVYE